MASLRMFIVTFVLIYLLPALGAAGLWAISDRPGSWRDAKWSSAGILPPEKQDSEAAIYVFSAMTGGMKGALASHAWIVIKESGAKPYMRYDKVGWGSPIRRNSYPADAYWYSNAPRLVREIRGPQAERLIPKVNAAIAAYPYSAPGGYRIYPGPNSNTFVAHVLRSVPQIGAVLPPDAVGRDYLPNGDFIDIDADWRDVHMTFYGLLGVAFGQRSGVEVHFLGLVAGLDLARPGVKIPGFGRIGL